MRHREYFHNYCNDICILLPDNYDTEGQDLFEGLTHQLKQFRIGEKTYKWCMRERESNERERERERENGSISQQNDV